MLVRERVPGGAEEIAGNELFIREVGTGAPALFVHGLGGNSTNWTDLMWMLSDRLHCVAPDLPGFGRSGPAASGDYSPKAQADVLAVAEVGGRGGGIRTAGWVATPGEFAA